MPQKSAPTVKLHNLSSTRPRRRRRVGRGTGSGAGKTAGRGTKGQNARSGGGVKARFEGGHTPLFKLLPKKRGFSSRYKKMASVNVSDLDKRFTSGQIVTIKKLRELSLIGTKYDKYKVLGSGEIKKKLTIFADAVSKEARAKIEKVGGTLKLSGVAKSKGSKKSDKRATKTEETKKNVQKVS